MDHGTWAVKNGQGSTVQKRKEGSLLRIGGRGALSGN